MENTRTAFLRAYKAYQDHERLEDGFWFWFDVDEWRVCLLLPRQDLWSQRIDEAQHKGIPLGGQYSAVIHPPRTPQGMKHLHAFARNNQIFALNLDGSAHDASHGVRIPNKVAKAIKSRFPDFSLPPGNLIEWLET